MSVRNLALSIGRFGSREWGSRPFGRLVDDSSASGNGPLSLYYGINYVHCHIFRSVTLNNSVLLFSLVHLWPSVLLAPLRVHFPNGCPPPPVVRVNIFANEWRRFPQNWNLESPPSISTHLRDMHCRPRDEYMQAYQRFFRADADASAVYHKIVSLNMFKRFVDTLT